MILLIDNYDSFSYNLYQLIGSIDPDIKVVRNDEMRRNRKSGPKPYNTFTGTGAPVRRRRL